MRWRQPPADRVPGRMIHRPGALELLREIGWDGDWEWLRDCEEHARGEGRTMVEELTQFRDAMVGTTRGGILYRSLSAPQREHQSVPGRMTFSVLEKKG